MRRVLVVDDEENLRLVLRTFLRKHGYEVEVAETAEAALGLLDAFGPDFVLADVRMPGMSGIELCAELRARSSTATVVVMSAFGSVELALEAMKAGAYDYISKPFQQDEVLLVLKKAEEREALRRENRALKEAIRNESRFGQMLGRSEAMREVFRTIDKVAGYKTTVLVTGESGTGKELVARALHDQSPRADAPFVAVNCGAIPEALLESELFGHKKGAFTDAHADKLGLFAEADGGTLFLDEIGELPMALQVKLLRALQESTIRRLGDTKDRKVDVRVVAATVRDLKREVEASRFREDLYYRLNVLQIVVPPLRARREDIPMLVEHFVDRNNRRLGTSVRGVEAKAQKLLLEYHWPGNVRELENLVERAVVLSEGDVLTVADLPERVREPSDPVAVALGQGELSIKKTQRYMEETLIRRALQKTGGNRTQAAKLLEISHRALLYKIKEYGVA
ncbi:MAG TPA: sigma-54 dependent transcriptional regulator [Polyangiaceae bacterium LLY-WYZ-14_1]|nr:sigma-54 dependent transcriptional regulator [Polyangiaceae bacterium LLY-WYZ-14_1]